MARAHSIFVAAEHLWDNTEIIAAFTVKYEMVRWLEERRSKCAEFPQLFIYRFRDGEPGAVAEFNEKEFLRDNHRL